MGIARCVCRMVSCVVLCGVRREVTEAGGQKREAVALHWTAVRG